MANFDGIFWMAFIYILDSMLFQILIHLSILIFKAEIDLLMIKRGVDVPHNLWIYLLAPITIYLWCLNSSTLFSLLTLIHGFIFWILFDIYLNKRRNLDYDYTGEGSFLDRFLNWFKKKNINILVPKFICLTISVVRYYVVKQSLNEWIINKLKLVSVNGL